jgi:translation initiation factor IF-3
LVAKDCVNFLLRCARGTRRIFAATTTVAVQQLEKETRISDPRTNDRIRVPEVRLVGPNGEQVGVVRIEDALRLAAEADLDLVEVAPNSKPPVAKIMDFGKFKYETAQKAKEARRNQANTILKEVRFRLKIDVHDYETKRKRAEGFLQAGDKVKAMILFRGREQSRPEQGHRLLQKFAEDVAEFGSVESSPTIDGRNMVMVIGPLKNKAEAKAEAEARRVANKPPRPDVAPEAQAPKVAVVEKSTPARETVAAPAAAAAAQVAPEVPAAAAPTAPEEKTPEAAAPVAAKPAVTAPVAAKTVQAPKAPTAAKPATPRAPAPKAPAGQAPAPKAPTATPKTTAAARAAAPTKDETNA